MTALEESVHQLIGNEKLYDLIDFMMDRDMRGEIC